jgi:hypothetical protein
VATRSHAQQQHGYSWPPQRASKMCVAGLFKLIMGQWDELGEERGLSLLFLQAFIILIFIEILHRSPWGFSSNGRAPASHAGGRGIDAPKLQTTNHASIFFCCSSGLLDRAVPFFLLV